MSGHIRALDAFEAMQCLPGPGKDFITCLAVGYDGHLAGAALQLALKNLQRRLPLLRVSIQKSRDSLVYSHKNVGPISLHVVESDDPNRWKQEVDTYLHSAFPLNSGPLAKFKLVKHPGGGTLIIAAHHVIMDGTSLLHVARELFESVADGGKLSSPPQNNYFPSLGQLVGSKTPKGSLQPDLWGNCKSTILKNNPKPNLPNRTGVLFRELPPATALSLRQATKSRGIQMQGAFMAGLVRALGRKLHRHPLAEQTRQIHYECPVCLRPFLGTSVRPDDLGSFIGLVQFQKQLSLCSDPWALATEVHRSLHDRLDPLLPAHSYSAVEDLMGAHPDFTSLRAAQDRQMPYIGVSNLGKIAFPSNPTPCCKIRFLFPSGALHGAFYGEDNAYATIATLADQTFITLVYPASHMSGVTANRLFDDFVDELSSMSIGHCAIPRRIKIA
jgi:Condensation domain